MRWLALLVLIPAAALARAQEAEAEKLYRAMEKKIRVARTLVVEFNSEIAEEKKKFTVKGTIHIAAGNKTRLDLESEIFELGGKTFVVTNGKAKYAKVGNVVYRDGPFTPEGEVMFALIARFGAANAAMEKKIATPELDKEFPVKNFKLGVKEMVDKREAQVVHYQIHLKEHDESHDVSLWLDTKTQLPLKRVTKEKADGNKLQTNEIYRAFTVDSKLDGKLFEIPAK
jgi:outer membrane lipoprotein-sorting protein